MMNIFDRYSKSHDLNSDTYQPSFIALKHYYMEIMVAKLRMVVGNWSTPPQVLGQSATNSAQTNYLILFCDGSSMHPDDKTILSGYAIVDVQDRCIKAYRLLIQHTDLVKDPLAAMMLPSQIAIIQCAGH